MLKKFLGLLALLVIVSGCSIVETNSDYDNTVNLALDSKIGTPNYSGGSFTFYLPTNSRVVSSQIYSSVVKQGNVSYTVSVNVAQYLIATGSITKNSEGEYVIVNESEINEDIAEYSGVTFETRRILFNNNYAASPEENKATALGVLEMLNSSEYASDSSQFIALFSSLASQYSHDERSKNNGGILKGLTVSEMSPSYFEVITSLEVGTYTTELVETEEGYQIVYLEGITSDETIDIDFDTIIDDSNLFYSYNDSDLSVHVISYDGIFNVIALNQYSSVSAVVTEENIDDAIFNSIILLRGININDSIAIRNYVNDDVASKPKLINLNEENAELTQAIENTYSYEFSSSFSEGYDSDDSNTRQLYSFNSRELTPEEIQAIEEEKIRKEEEEKQKELEEQESAE